MRTQVLTIIVLAFQPVQLGMLWQILRKIGALEAPAAAAGTKASR